MNGAERYMVIQKTIAQFVQLFNLGTGFHDANVLFYPIWVEEYSNTNYVKTLTVDGLEKKPSKKVIEQCTIDLNNLTEYLSNHGV